MKNNAQDKDLLQFEEWLNSFLNFEKLPQKNMFWLDTMQHYCSLLGNVQNNCPSVHVAGSKGKGSVCAMISSILEEAGYKTGLYTSPHIITFLERISRNQKLLSKKVYKKSAVQLKECVQNELNSASQKEHRPITWFELVTLYAFLCFKNAKMDWAVYETGLGGRLDATNIINPKVCCIGPIELEHTEFLGDTVEKIAAEKAGIIKPDTPVFVQAQEKDSVRKVFIDRAKELNAPIYFVDEVCKSSIKYTSSHSFKQKSFMEVEIRSEFFKRPLKTTLRFTGDVQVNNAALAALAVKSILPDIDEKIIEKGLARASLPGRFELSRPPKKFKNCLSIIYDGAHTFNSISLTMQTVRELFADKIITLLFACAKDKDVNSIVPLFKNRVEKAFVTIPGLVKQSDLQKVEQAFVENKIEYSADSDFKAQIVNALTFASQTKSILLVTGSFYLVSEAKKLLNKNPGNPL
ncbi:MAG: bifunctional folylpolyglutamate synthase/dihydrofolate synthase [Treponema sp.]|nr:bifunctional folylpolyglutamate synthase/dihydrofolate synthase [Treponema sp.]